MFWVELGFRSLHHDFVVRIAKDTGKQSQLWKLRGQFIDKIDDHRFFVRPLCSNNADRPSIKYFYGFGCVKYYLRSAVEARKSHVEGGGTILAKILRLVGEAHNHRERLRFPCRRS